VCRQSAGLGFRVYIVNLLVNLLFYLIIKKTCLVCTVTSGSDIGGVLGLFSLGFSLGLSA
jgi:hypothetical protein